MKRDIAVLTFLCKYRYAFGFFVNIFKQPRTFGSGHFFVLDTLYCTTLQSNLKALNNQLNHDFRGVCNRAFRKCKKDKSETLTKEAKEKMYDEIGTTLDFVKTYAVSYEKRSAETKRLLEQFKADLTSDQANFKDIDDLLAKTDKMSNEEYDNLLRENKVSEAKVQELKKKRSESTKKIKQDLESAKNQTQSGSNIAMNSKLSLLI